MDNNNEIVEKTLQILHEWLICIWNLIQIIFSVGRLASGLGTDEKPETLPNNTSILLQHMLAQEENEELYNLSHLELLRDDRDLSRSISIKISNINKKLSQKESARKKAHRRHTIVGVCLDPNDEITTRNSMDSTSKLVTSYGCSVSTGNTFHTSASKDDIHTLMNNYLDPTLYRKAVSYPTSPAEIKSSPRLKRTTIFWKFDRSELVLNSDSNASSLNNTPKHSRQGSNCRSWNALENSTTKQATSMLTQQDSQLALSNHGSLSLDWNDTPQTKELTNMASTFAPLLKSTEEGNPKTETTSTVSDQTKPKLKSRRYQNETSLDEILSLDRNNTEMIPLHSHHFQHLENFTMEEVLDLKERLENYKFP